MSALAISPDFRSPAHLAEALALLAHGGWQPLAGGTDLYPAHVGRPLRSGLMDLHSLRALQGITTTSSPEGGAVLRLGALTTWTDLRETPLPAGLEALSQAAAEIGGRQVQNRGTLGGNVCNASPAADGIPVLLALDAMVELHSASVVRRLPMADFVLGNRHTARASDELLVAIEVRLPGARARSAFLKLGHRRFLVISVVMLAVLVDLDACGRILHCAIAAGACSVVAQRLHALELRLRGCALAQAPELTAQWLRRDGNHLLASLAPINDVRGTARYRLDALCSLIPRALAGIGTGDVAGTMPN